MTYDSDKICPICERRVVSMYTGWAGATNDYLEHLLEHIAIALIKNEG